MAGESQGPNFDMLALQARLSQGGSDGDSGSGGGGLFGIIPNASINWFPLQQAAPGALGEVQLAFLAGYGNPRKFSTKLMKAIEAMGDGFLKNLTNGVQSSSFAELGHLKHGFGHSSGSGFGMDV